MKGQLITNIRMCCVILAIAIGLTGCSIPKVKSTPFVNVNKTQHNPKKELKFYDSFIEINKPYRIIGHIASYYLPHFRNTKEIREEMIINAASELGADGIVSLYHTRIGLTASGIAIAALPDIDNAQKNRPQFIIGMPPIIHNIPPSDDNLELLEETILDSIRYCLTIRGYHVNIIRNIEHVNLDIIDKLSNQELRTKYGLETDYIFVVSINDENGNPLSSFNRYGDFYLEPQLYSISDRKIVWAYGNQRGGTNLAAQVIWGGLLGALVGSFDDSFRESMYYTVNRMFEDIPYAEHFGNKIFQGP